MSVTKLHCCIVSIRNEWQYLSPGEVLVEAGAAGAEAVEEACGGRAVVGPEAGAPPQRAVTALPAAELLGERVYFCNLLLHFNYHLFLTGWKIPIY